MIETPESYKRLVSKTIFAIKKQNDKTPPVKRKSLPDAVLTFGQFLCLIAVVGGEDLKELEKE